MMTYPASTGRNFDEILRCVDSLQLTSSKEVATPADWENGDDVIVNFPLTDKAAEETFGLVRFLKAQSSFLYLIIQPVCIFVIFFLIRACLSFFSGWILGRGSAL